MGALPAVLYCLEIDDASLLYRATLDHDPDGEPYLARKGREAKLAPNVQPPPAATTGTRTDLDRALQLNGSDGWLDVHGLPDGSRLPRPEGEGAPRRTARVTSLS